MVQQKNSSDSETINTSLSTEGNSLLVFMLNIFLHKRKLLLVFLSTCFVLSFLVFGMPKSHSVSLDLVLPDRIQVEKVKLSAVRQVNYWNSRRLFSEFEQHLVMRETFDSFFERLIDDSKVKGLTGWKKREFFTLFWDAYQVDIIEPIAKRGEMVDQPTRINVAFTSVDEEIAIAFMEEYLDFINETVKQELINEFDYIKSVEIINLETEISALRSIAKKENDLEAEKLEREILERVEGLLLEKRLLVEKQKHDREYQIERIQDELKFKRNRLQNELQAATEMEKNFRQNKIAETEEALKVAKAMGIKWPRYPSGFTETVENNEQAKVSILQNSSIPLQFMGTVYLENLLAVLKQRENDALFSETVPSLVSELSVLGDDAQLKLLSNRSRDEAYVANISELEKEIQSAQNDVRLKHLKSRKNFDAYIPGIVDLVSRKEEIENMNTDLLSDLQFYSLRDVSYNTNVFLFKKMKFAVIGILVLSFVFAVFIVGFYHVVSLQWLYVKSRKNNK